MGDADKNRWNPHVHALGLSISGEHPEGVVCYYIHTNHAFPVHTNTVRPVYKDYINWAEIEIVPRFFSLKAHFWCDKQFLALCFDEKSQVISLSKILLNKSYCTSNLTFVAMNTMQTASSDLKTHVNSDDRIINMQLHKCSSRLLLNHGSWPRSSSLLDLVYESVLNGCKENQQGAWEIFILKWYFGTTRDI